MPGTVTKLSKLHVESNQYYEEGVGGRTDALIAIHRNAREQGLTKVLNEAHAYRTEDGELVVFLVTEEATNDGTQ